MNSAIRTIRAVLRDWDPGDYSASERPDGGANVALGLDLTGTSAANGGNAACGLVDRLLSAGLDVRHGGDHDETWQYLLAGGDLFVYVTERVRTPELAVRLYGPPDGLTRAQRNARLQAAARWARRNVGEPVDDRSPLEWDRGAVEEALARPVSGRGNRTRRNTSG